MVLQHRRSRCGEGGICINQRRLLFVLSATNSNEAGRGAYILAMTQYVVLISATCQRQRLRQKESLLVLTCNIFLRDVKENV
jgi:hypothetical protein